MKTHLWAIGLILLCTIMTSSAQIFYKIGSAKLSLDIFALITNFPLIAGLILYALGSVLLILALKGGEVTVLIPIIATSYIWVSLLSVSFLGEVMNTYKWLGVGTILIGVLFVSMGSKQHAEAI